MKRGSDPKPLKTRTIREVAAQLAAEVKMEMRVEVVDVVPKPDIRKYLGISWWEATKLLVWSVFRRVVLKEMAGEDSGIVSGLIFRDWRGWIVPVLGVIVLLVGIFFAFK